jgi:transcriptional regulator with XRE-family HTH domain
LSPSSDNPDPVERHLDRASRRLGIQRAFGECLQRLREEHNLSVAQLADRAGVLESAIRKAEQGRTDAKVSLIDALAQGLSVPPAAIVEYLAEYMQDPAADPEPR